MEILKHLSIKHHCKACKKKLFTQKLIVSVPADFKVSDLTKEVKKTTPNLICATDPVAAIDTTYIIYHEVKIVTTK